MAFLRVCVCYHPYHQPMRGPDFLCLSHHRKVVLLLSHLIFGNSWHVGHCLLGPWLSLVNCLSLLFACFPQGFIFSSFVFKSSLYVMWHTLSSYVLNVYIYSFFFGCTCSAVCRILEPGPQAVKTLSPNHWTTREFPRTYSLFLKTLIFLFCIGV